MRRTPLAQVLREEQVDALVGEARRGQDGRQVREAFGAQAGLLEQLTAGAGGRRLVRLVQHAGRQLPDESAGGVAELVDERHAALVVDRGHRGRTLVADHLELHVLPVRQA